MEREDDLEKLLESIKSSEVVENRIQLLAKLGGTEPLKESDLAMVLECLITLWDDTICLDISQCMLNKTVLHVAANYLKSETVVCQRYFLDLGAKASLWCGKHLNMTFLPAGESQEEEHSCLFSELLLELLNFSVACFSTVSGIPFFDDEMLRDAVEKFIMEQLTLVKDLIPKIKGISFGSELLKVSQSVLDAATKLCRVSALAINWNSCDDIAEKGNIPKEKSSKLNYITKIMKCTIQKLCELGVLAADGGGTLVTVLNLSWKGVVSLLQLGKGALAEKINVADIIRSLISLAFSSLQSAAEAWCSVEDAISVSEAKRAFLPIKFFLINATRICSQYPSQAYTMSNDISACVLMVSTLAITLSNNDMLKNVVEALEEHLKPTVLHLLYSLLNTAHVNEKQKCQILDCLFSGGSDLSSHHDQIASVQTLHLDKFSINFEAMPKTGVPLVGPVMLFIDLLRVGPQLEEDVILGICRKFEWFLDALTDEVVYSSILVLQIPAPCGSANSSVLWKPLFSCLLHSMKVFMVSISSQAAWSEMQNFLLANFFHPHFLCQEIVMELWSFMVRHFEVDVVNGLIDKLCSLYKMVASSASFPSPGSALRRMARLMQMLLSSSTEYVVDRVYSFVTNDEKSHLSMLMLAALLMEGLQLSSLSANMRKSASERIIRDYIHFVEKFNKSTMNSCYSDLFGLQVVILSAAMESLQVKPSDLDTKTLKSLVITIHSYQNTMNNAVKGRACILLNDLLRIVSSAAELYGSDMIEEVILELQRLFISGPSHKDAEIHKCKSGLTLFMAGLASMKFPDCEGSAKSTAICDLYHMLLKERHWALVHLATASFGHFAARTSCNQLWRFLPHNAALAFDLESGTDAEEGRFMAGLQVFLERQSALSTTKPNSEQLRLAIKEATILKDLFHKNSKVDVKAQVLLQEDMEIDCEFPPNKRRKLPDGFSQGMELLQSGLKLMSDGLSRWKQDHHDRPDLSSMITTHFTNLEDAINQLSGLANGE